VSFLGFWNFNVFPFHPRRAVFELNCALKSLLWLWLTGFPLGCRWTHSLHSEVTCDWASEVRLEVMPASSKPGPKNSLESFFSPVAYLDSSMGWRTRGGGERVQCTCLFENHKPQHTCSDHCLCYSTFTWLGISWVAYEWRLTFSFLTFSLGNISQQCLLLVYMWAKKNLWPESPN
jgi:hypothetical protein